MMSFRDVKRMGITLVGVMLLFFAIFAASYAVAHQEHQHHAQAVLIQSERAAMAKIARQSHGASCQVAGVRSGQLSGILSIPALDMTAPVEEGTDDQELNVAVGHDPQSVWPGLTGAAVFLAHDVSYFVHLNQLEPGDVITYQTVCNTVKFAGQRPAGGARRLAGRQHDRPEHGARHLLAAQRAVLHTRTVSSSAPRRWARRPRAPTT